MKQPVLIERHTERSAVRSNPIGRFTLSAYIQNPETQQKELAGWLKASEVSFIRGFADGRDLFSLMESYSGAIGIHYPFINSLERGTLRGIWSDPPPSHWVRPWGIIDLLVVIPRWRGHGVGHALATHALRDSLNQSQVVSLIPQPLMVGDGARPIIDPTGVTWTPRDLVGCPECEPGLRPHSGILRFWTRYDPLHVVPCPEFTEGPYVAGNLHPKNPLPENEDAKLYPLDPYEQAIIEREKQIEKMGAQLDSVFSRLMDTSGQAALHFIDAYWRDLYSLVPRAEETVQRNAHVEPDPGRRRALEMAVTGPFEYQAEWLYDTLGAEEAQRTIHRFIREHAATPARLNTKPSGKVDRDP